MKLKYLTVVVSACASLGISAQYLYEHTVKESASSGNRCEIMSHPMQKPVEKENQVIPGPDKIILNNTCAVGVGEYHYVPKFYASIVSDDGDVVKRSKFRFGMYDCPNLHQDPFILKVDNLLARYGGVRIGDIYYNVTQWGPSHDPTYYLRKYDISTWQMTEEITLKDASLYSDCVAADPTTGYVYGCFRTNGVNSGSYEISIADYKNKNPYRLSALHKCTSKSDIWNACAFTTAGQLYAINMEGDLLKVDKTKGTGTVVGSTGLTPYGIASAFVDPDTDKLYYIPALEDLTSAIYEIDLTNGAATKILNFPEGLSLAGAVPASPIPAQAAPGRPSDVKYEFLNGELTGTISFKASSKTFANKSMSGTLKWRVVENDEVVASGETTPGATVSATMAVSASGLHNFYLILSNATGDSPRTFTHMHIGSDKPCRPSDVLLTYDHQSGDVNLTWEAIDKGENDGYFNSSEVTYRVTDLFAGEVVADNLTECKYQTNIAGAKALKNHSYKVEAKFREQVSEGRESNPAVPGQLTLPFVDKFENLDFIPNGYHVINVEEDLNTWTPYIGLLMCHMSPLGIDMDDWLFTPPLYLEGGKMYQVSADMASRFQKCVERIEVLWGDNNHPSAMTHTGMAAFDLLPGEGNYIQFNNFSFNLMPETTGYYYVAFHGISKADQGSILLDNLTISDAMIPGTPCQVTDLVLTPGQYGAHKVKLSFTTPSMSVDGEQLTAIEKIEIERDGEVVGTIDNPTPGTAITYEDVMKYGGWKEYLVTPYTSAGAGQTNRKSCFVGSYMPAAVTDLAAYENGDTGNVTITWTPPQTDYYGAKLTPENLFYRLYNSDGNTDSFVKGDIEGTSHTFKACEPEERKFLLFGLSAVSASGEGPKTWTGMIPVGKPDPLPYKFSFSATDFETTPIIRQYLSDTTWDVAEDTSIGGINSADGDNGFAYFYSYSPDCQAALFTSKIGLPEDSDPALSLEIFKLYSDQVGENTNTLEILVSDGCGGWQTLRTITIGQLPEEGWNRVVLPLRNFKGKGVQLQLLATNKTYPWMFIDNINVVANADKDLAMESVSAPTTVKSGEEFVVDVTIRNNGASDVSDYELQLYVNGEKRKEYKGNTVPGGESVMTSLPYATLPHDQEECTLQVKIDWSEDTHADNNVSTTLNLLNTLPPFNVPTGLKAVRNDDGNVTLSWNKVSLEGNLPYPEISDFEEYTPWKSNPDLTPWALYDGDRGGIGGINGYTFPGEIKKGTMQSYWVMDDRGEGLNQSFLAHSGHKYLSTMYSADLSQQSFTPVKNDDWLISPELPGCAQTISFYAKSYVYTMLETLEVLVSSDSNDPADFVSIGKIDKVHYEWTRYSFDLPEGTTYFALRCISNNQFMLFIDDVSCVASGFTPFEHLGYKVYRDGICITESPISTIEFNDGNVDDNTEYYVTAVYNHGESVASKRVKISDSGLSTTIDDAAVVKYIYAPDGKRISSLEPGVNVVIMSDGTTRKVIIK